MNRGQLVPVEIPIGLMIRRAGDAPTGLEDHRGDQTLEEVSDLMTGPHLSLALRLCSNPTNSRSGTNESIYGLGGMLGTAHNIWM